MNFLEIIKDYLIRDYRSYNAVNYSLLKEIYDGYYKSIRDGIPEKSSTSLDFGSYIDQVISTGQKPEVYTYKQVELGGHSKILVDELLKIYPSAKCTIAERLDLANSLDLWSTTKKEDKREALVNSNDINTILEREQARKEGKNVISEEDLSVAEIMLNTLYTHEYSKNIVDPPLDIESYKQLPLRFIFNNIECKILIDDLEVDHKNKTLQPIDLKTGTDFDFLGNYYKYKYFLQGTFYYLGVLNLINKIPELKDYTILPFKFLYISRERPDLPLIYRMTNKSIEKYTEGYFDIYNKYKKGIIDLLEEYKFHTESGIFDISKEIHDDKGILIIPEPV